MLRQHLHLHFSLTDQASKVTYTGAARQGIVGEHYEGRTTSHVSTRRAAHSAGDTDPSREQNTAGWERRL